MTKARHFLLTLYGLFLAAGVMAQATQWEVNLAAITDVNITLNENCEAMVVPSMILSGDYDVDGDGELPPDMAFDIVVEDNNPNNGPIIDGCGSWTWRATARETFVTPLPVMGFETDFAEINWEVISNGPGAVATFTPDTVFLTSAGTGGVQGTGNETGGADIDNILVAYTFPVGGQLKFGYEYDLESALLTDIFIIDIDGNLITRIEPAANDGTTQGAGTFDEMIAAGNRVAIQIQGDDFVSNGDTSRVKFFDFMFQQEDVPGELIGFTTAWGTINAEDKTSPELRVIPVAPAELFCTDVANIDINALPNNVSRCFTVDGTTGAPTSFNFFNTALGRRLQAGGGIPTFFDGCSDIEVCVNDIVTSTDACSDVVITRVFTATDGDCPSVSGEENEPTVAQYDITFTRPSLADVMGVPEEANFSCTQFDFSDPNPQPVASDYPFITRANGSRIFLNNAFCNIGATFNDGPRIVTCVNTYKFVRTYTVVDWCDTGNALTFTQVVKVGDFTGPTLTAPTQDLNFDGVPDVGPLFFSTNSTDCTSFFPVPAVGATDDCSDNIDIEVFILPNGDASAQPIGPFAPGDIAPSIPLGLHTMRYTATDDCGNEATPIEVQIRIGDATAPVAICEDGLNISIGGAGFAVLQAADVNAASYDECSDVSLLIGRVGDDNDLLPGASYLPSLTLNCDDLGTVRVGLRVADAEGNVNFCWLDVLVEDKSAPVCVAPAPVTVTCADLDGDFPQDLEALADADPDGTAALLDAQFGAANGLDNCPGVDVDQVVFDNRTSCGSGTISRTFVVTDAVGLTSSPGCRQLITVLGLHDYTIVFPGDRENDNCIEPDFNDVTFDERGCDLITVAVDIDTFLATADECYKLRVSYEVLNWCEYNTEDPAYRIPRDADNDNNLTEDTYLHILPNSEATLTDDVAILDRDNNPNNSNTIASLDTGDGGILPGSDAAGYGQDGSRGAFTYQQFVKVYDDEAPTLVITQPENGQDVDGDCVDDIAINFTIADDCSPASVNATAQLDAFINDSNADGVFTLAEFVNDGGDVTSAISGSGGNLTINLADLPPGRHAVRIIATDGCGNTAVDLVVFEIEDAKGPTPICINGLTVTLMPDGQGGGMAEIWAIDFIASPMTDCSGEVKYAIYLASVAAAPGFTPDVDDVGLTLTCADDATTIVRIYAIDPEGQSDYCETTLLVQANDATICGGSSTSGTLVGSITTEGAAVVPGVTVNISGDDAASTTTDANGIYSFSGLTVGNDFTVAPSFDSYVHHINGVSTFDLVLISRHILGLDEFASPFQFLAADANGDENVSVQDIIAIRRLILGLDNAYFNSPAWRFVDGNFVFPSNTNPWATTFPEVYNINNLPGTDLNGNFLAVMVGNIDGNGIPGNFTGAAEDRSSNRFELNTQELDLEAGNIYTVEFTADDAAQLEGFQGTLNFNDAVAFVGLEYAAAQAGNFNTAYASRGSINLSFNTKA
ncbi:MAG: hypothetical protein AAF828_08970, partial [Bacteroidota bacterium]